MCLVVTSRLAVGTLRFALLECFDFDNFSSCLHWVCKIHQSGPNNLSMPYSAQVKLIVQNDTRHQQYDNCVTETHYLIIACDYDKHRWDALIRLHFADYCMVQDKNSPVFGSIIINHNGFNWLRSSFLIYLFVNFFCKQLLWLMNPCTLYEMALYASKVKYPTRHFIASYVQPFIQQYESITEKIICNQSSQYENYGWLLLWMEAITCLLTFHCE